MEEITIEIPTAVNEPIRDYVPGSPERSSLKSKLVEMDSKGYHNYLKRFYSLRKVVNYVITPICFGIYVYGLSLLFPYFKREFSEGFYIYLVVSGIVSLLVIAFIIIRGIVKENQFYNELLEK